jgi:hypothetical protein
VRVASALLCASRERERPIVRGVWALFDGSVNDPPVSTIRRWWEKIATCRSSTPIHGPLVLMERRGTPPHGSTPVSFVGRSPALDLVPSLLFSRRSFSHPLLALLPFVYLTVKNSTRERPPSRKREALRRAARSATSNERTPTTPRPRPRSRVAAPAERASGILQTTDPWTEQYYTTHKRAFRP